MQIKVPLILFLSIFISFSVFGQSRKKIHIPDIPGYRTLK
jgi:hypothetical protein